MREADGHTRGRGCLGGATRRSPTSQDISSQPSDGGSRQIQRGLQLADVVEALLADPAALAAVGRRAQAKARSWTEHDNALALVQHVQQALGLER